MKAGVLLALIKALYPLLRTMSCTQQMLNKYLRLKPKFFLCLPQGIWPWSYLVFKPNLKAIFVDFPTCPSLFFSITFLTLFHWPGKLSPLISLHPFETVHISRAKLKCQSPVKFFLDLPGKMFCLLNLWSHGSPMCLPSIEIGRAHV